MDGRELCNAGDRTQSVRWFNEPNLGRVYYAIGSPALYPIYAAVCRSLTSWKTSMSGSCETTTMLTCR
jgi:hypothetical protein